MPLVRKNKELIALMITVMVHAIILLLFVSIVFAKPANTAQHKKSEIITSH